MNLLRTRRHIDEENVPLTYGISSYELYVFDFATLTAKTLEHANLDEKIPIVCFMRLLFKFYPLMVAEF